MSTPKPRAAAARSYSRIVSLILFSLSPDHTDRSRSLFRRSVLFCLVMTSLLLTPAGAEVFVDDFDDNSIAAENWAVVVYGSGAQIAEQNQRLEFFMPGSASGTEFGTRLVSQFEMRGDFDIRVDYQLLQWPWYNGVRIAIAMTDNLYDNYGMERSSLSAIEPLGEHEVYIADFGPFVLVPTEDLSGTLRLVRSGATQTGYFLQAGEWIAVQTDTAPTRDITIQLHAWSHNYAFRDWDVRAAFDNFTVMTGELHWPETPARETSWGAVKRLYLGR